MKKIIALILCLLLCFSAVACTPTPDPTEPSGSSPADPTDSSPTDPSTAAPTEPTIPLDTPTEISGKWFFNETLTAPIFEGESYSRNVFFGAILTSSGIYYNMTLAATNGDPVSYSLSFNNTNVVYDSTANTWQSNEFRTIDFGEGNTVDRTFYLWLIENATPVE